jgi:riboflavin kinase
LPNVRFYKWCFQKFHVSKGICNTIDERLYENGVVNPFTRRMYLLSFLEFASQSILKSDAKKFVQFGSGGLSRKLDEFMDVCDKNESLSGHKTGRHKK